MNSEQQGNESNQASSSFAEQQGAEEEESEASDVVILAKTGDGPELQRLLEDENYPIQQAVINRALLRTLSKNSLHKQLIWMMAQDLLEEMGVGTEWELACLAMAVDMITRAVVRLLIETGGADVNTVETFPGNSIGFTALHYACARQLGGTVEYLCGREGIDLSPRDPRNHFTPMSLAIMADNKLIVSMLLEAGANANETFNENRDRSGNYLLQATLNESIDLVKVLLDHGASVNDRATGGKLSPIHVAKSREMVNLLIKHGASVHDQHAISGNTPLFSVKSPSAALALLEAGANIRHVNKLGQNALMHACEKGQADEKAQVLLEHGACLLDSECEQALTNAATKSRFTVVRLLLTRMAVALGGSHHCS